MIPIRNGWWTIQRVTVNSQGEAVAEGFHQLVVAEDHVRIEPAGISFSVQQATAKSAVLESRSQVFYLNFCEKGENLKIEMSRPSFAETITFEATLAEQMSKVSA